MGGPIIRNPAAQRWRAVVLAAIAAASLWAQDATAQDAGWSRQAICRTIEGTAAANGLPFGFLARLLWTESGFHSGVTSPAGAEGIAQFMPETAAQRGLADPWDPQQAIDHAARLLVDLDRQFGNLGLAAAAYNAGAARVAKWLQGASALPIETQIYVRAVTGRSAEEWAMVRASFFVETSAFPLTGFDCLNATGVPARGVRTVPPLPRIRQVRLDGSLATATAFLDAVLRDAGVPRPRPPTASDRAAQSLCAAIRAQGATCDVFGQ